MANFFQVAVEVEQYGSTFRATVFVDNDNKEARLSFSRNGYLFISLFPIAYGRVWDANRARKALNQRNYGAGLMTRLCNAAILHEPFYAVLALSDYDLTIGAAT